jgi:Na+/H+ antiporter NhaC
MAKLMYALALVLALMVFEPRLTDKAYITSVPVVLAGVVNEVEENINTAPVEYPVEYVEYIHFGDRPTNVVNLYDENTNYYMQEQIDGCSAGVVDENIIYSCITTEIDDWLSSGTISRVQRIALTYLAAQMFFSLDIR